ncbi:unnamed protein product [Vitrella brassicaformis CCMP3155]|uniref:Cyclin C-terminal domain-containing protein n=1 Tax=Vitrella brassicaformis (strain CCMP3155) TaxID=1169540 RepID=A0A0G4GIP7_VITBC|nr:unnamed protein product [Vitrella brassicaformis CCMP3155]|eukprot:CEM29749.1 unnamed protein product [Vitrella brassicaformis CCMP3155]
MAAVTVGSMTWPQQRAVLVDGMVKRAASMGCRDATVMRAVRLLAVRSDCSECGIGCLDKLFTAAGMDTHGRLFSLAKYLMFLSMCEIDLAACYVHLLAATAVYIIRKTNQKQIAGGIWSAALVAESSVSESALESSMTTLRMQRLMWGDTQTTKGIVTDAVDELFASPDRHGVASTRSHPQQEQQPHCQEGRQEHPLAHLFAEDRCRTPDISTTLQLRAASRDIRDAFSSDQLRSRLNNSLSRDGDGINTPQLQLVQFDPSLGMGELMAAVWIAEEGGRWDETREVLQWASQCGCCILPINLTADDIKTHANKTAYESVARVLAQLMVVGRYIDFGDGSRLQIFRHANGEVRAIRDEPGFRLEVKPPLPAGHLYQRHRLQHDPPVRSGIFYSDVFGRWGSSGLQTTDASVSLFAKHMILGHFYGTHQTNDTVNVLNRYVGGGRLDGLLTQSPHTPVAGCTTTFSCDGGVRFLVLTDSSHDFVAWIFILDLADGTVNVCVVTTEAPAARASKDAPFKDRYPVTTQLAVWRWGEWRHSDGHGGGWDDMDDDSNGEGSGAEEDNNEGDGDNHDDDSDSGGDGNGGNESDGMDDGSGGAPYVFDGRVDNDSYDDDTDDDGHHGGGCDDMDVDSGGEDAPAEEDNQDGGGDGNASP